MSLQAYQKKVAAINRVPKSLKELEALVTSGYKPIPVNRVDKMALGLTGVAIDQRVKDVAKQILGMLRRVCLAPVTGLAPR